MASVTVIIIAKNEEKMIGDCLKSVKWANEVIVIDNGSVDKTGSIAKSLSANVYNLPRGSFSDLRNFGIWEASGDWLLYIDADERVTEDLKIEIEKVVEKGVFNAYAIPRTNIILGKKMRRGGWWPDYVKRLFKKNKLKEWTGELHEEPSFEGELSHLKKPLLHIKHDNISDMVVKSNDWSDYEAKLFFETNHPKIVWWRFIRIMLTELWYRLVKLGGFLDGPEGIIYAFYQMWYRFLVYAKLWEVQIK